nr:uncharacterized protein LOC112748251 [Arachis hypogaea]
MFGYNKHDISVVSNVMFEKAREAEPQIDSRVCPSNLKPPEISLLCDLLLRGDTFSLKPQAPRNLPLVRSPSSRCSSLVCDPLVPFTRGKEEGSSLMKSLCVELASKKKPSPPRLAGNVCACYQRIRQL